MGSLSARQTAMLILLFVVTSVAFIVLYVLEHLPV